MGHANVLAVITETYQEACDGSRPISKQVKTYNLAGRGRIDSWSPIMVIRSSRPLSVMRVDLSSTETSLALECQFLAP
jgi:hypothetical protein